MYRESVSIVGKHNGFRTMVLAVLVAVISVDQVVKWWAWRHVSTARINYGGNAFVGSTVSRWYANPASGALLDLLDFGLLTVAVAVLLHRRRPAIVRLTGTLMIGGWTSNLVDRLGMHYWTAPGSVRGAVDFIPLGNLCYNVADLFIVCGTGLFLLAACVWTTSKSTATGSRTPAIRHRFRVRGRMSAIAAACLIGVVGFGAVNYGGVTVPSTPVSAARHW